MEHVSIWGTPFPAILNQKNLTGSARGAKTSKNWPIFVPSKIPNFGCFWPLLPTRSNFWGNRGHHEIICELSSHLWSLDDSARTFDDSVMSVKKGTVWNYSWDIFWSAVWWTMVPEAWQEKPQNGQRCTMFHYSFKPWSVIQRAIVGGAMLH